MTWHRQGVLEIWKAFCAISRTVNIIQVVYSMSRRLTISIITFLDELQHLCTDVDKTEGQKADFMRRMITGSVPKLNICTVVLLLSVG